MTINRARLINYLRLMRVHKPIPIALNFLPVLIIIFIEYFLDLSVKGESQAPLWTLCWISVIGSFIVRSLGCVINDFFDKDFDKTTKRTKDRPLALENNDPAKPTNIGIIILVFSLSIVALFLASILGKVPLIIGLFTGALTIVYPFTKRFFFLPQLFLGVVYNMGIIIICSAVPGWLNFQSFLFFFITILWTLAYDTVYAKPDAEYDIQNSLKSSVLTFGVKWSDVVGKIYNIVFGLLLILGGITKVFVFTGVVVVSFLFIKYNYSKMVKTENFQKFFEYNSLIFLFLLSGIGIDILLLYINS